MTAPSLRVGHGFDVHRFDHEYNAGKGSAIILGGVTVPCEYEIIAHSDGDVLVHALCDAILGAIAKGDIGTHFPDSDEQYRNIASTRLLEKVLSIARKDNWYLINIDVTLVAEVPRLSPYVNTIKTCLAELTGLTPDSVNVKATTTESLGFTGRREGIAAHAVVLMWNKTD